MEISNKRILGALVIAGALALGVVQPASAYSGDTTVVTVKGHVTEPDGTPVKGVVAQADCGCGGATGAHSLGRDTTSATGFYSFTVQRQYALNIGFNHPHEKYRSVGRSAGTTTTNGSGYIIDVTMKKNSVITGTILGTDGKPSPYAVVKVYDAKTGKGQGSSRRTNQTTGKFSVYVKEGDYKVLFGGADIFVNQGWYGGLPTRAQSPTVSVGYGKTVSGINGTVSPKPTISGGVTIDGQKPNSEVRERIAFTLFDSAGEEVGRTVTATGFTFIRLPAAGDYTIDARSLEGGPDWVNPIVTPVTIAPGTAVTGLVIPMTSIPASASSTRTTAVEFIKSTKGIATAGKPIAGKFVVSSYGNVTGGKLLVYVNGRKVDSRVVPASGRINWRYTPKSVVFGKFTIRVKYLGTETTRAHNTIVYGLFGD